jgi:hypothetical protein
MTWIKNAIIDVAITAVIVAYALTMATWSWWIIAIYTPLMVLLKVFALSGAASSVQRKADDVPSWFYHVLYAANVLLLLYASFLYAAIGWAAIWILSTIVESKNKPKMKKA